MSLTKRLKILAFMACDTPGRKMQIASLSISPEWRKFRFGRYGLSPCHLNHIIYNINHLRGDKGVSLGCHRVSPMKPRRRENDAG
jgi:hypothetical protein